jgi:ribonuclease VapC
VLDASALLAFIQEEPGANLVSEAIDNGAIISTVNLCDVVTKLLDGGFSEAQIQVLLRSVRFETAAFDVDNAWRAALLRQETGGPFSRWPIVPVSPWLHRLCCPL